MCKPEIYLSASSVFYHTSINRICANMLFIHFYQIVFWLTKKYHLHCTSAMELNLQIIEFTVNYD